jgi:hypothetical protein
VRVRSRLIGAFIAALAFSSAAPAQTPNASATPRASKPASSEKSTAQRAKQPVAKAPGSDAQAAAHVDLSGTWGYGLGGSFSPKGGPGDVGTPADGVPYQPWALAKLKSVKTASGPNATFDTRAGADLKLTSTTDPVEQCDPPGVPRIYAWPSKFKFVQTPDVVYMLYEYGPTWRSVWLNRKHPDDPDPSFWGHSIGRYEGSDTFIVDTVGFNDKTWVDEVGRPHTEKLHVIERYRRLDASTLAITITIDDPGAYTAAWTFGPKTVRARSTDFGASVWLCTVDENRKFFGDVVKPTIPGTPSEK